MRKILLIKLTLLVLCFSGGLARAQTSVFTYQGKLTDTNAVANGQYDFMFRLFDSSTGGTQIGSSAECNGTSSGNADAVCDNVPVTNGIFTVELIFGSDAFADGGLRFLEISVRPGTSTGSFQPLTPRQQITSSPFSMKSRSATFADTLSSACVLCVTDGKIESIDGSKVTGTVANATTATNVSGIVPIANGGTGSSTKNFVDLSTNQTIFGNKTFPQTTTLSFANIGSLSGGGATFNGLTITNPDPVTISGTLNVGGAVTAEQFAGSGEGLTNVPGTFKWQTVAGLSQQAVRNTGYLANNDSQVTITLPDSPSLVVGDTVRISGIGTGGWKIAQNDGQSIIGLNIGLHGSTWTPRESNRNWFAVASSADGNKLIAAAQNGQLYTSTDSGVSWTPRESNRYWQAVASSADGTKLVAIVLDGQIYTSVNSGVSWTPQGTTRAWQSIASSADGNKLVAAVVGGQIYTSTDAGVNWTPRETNRNWQAVASSADGTKLIAVVSPGFIYISANSGVTWTPREGSRFWAAVASSADGTKFVAADFGGQIYISNDSGTSWIARGFNNNWFSVASNADGTKLVAVGINSQIFTSADSGFNWTPRDTTRGWQAVASSASGAKLIAGAGANQRLYISTSATTFGTTGYLTGEQSSAIELQYIGNGQFIPISYSGTISGF